MATTLLQTPETRPSMPPDTPISEGRIRRASERGRTQIDWLDSRHSFSFGGYHDPAHMGFSDLRVINEDRVQPGSGFGSHPHRDMEILSWVLGGALEHRDSHGHEGVIRPGVLQRMSAGTGVVHSEWNASTREPVHFLQIWLLPERRSITPGYEQRAFPAHELADGWRLLAARDGRDGAVTIHQDAEVWATRLAPRQSRSWLLPEARSAWLHVARGTVLANGVPLAAGDGVALTEPGRLALHGIDAAEIILFNLRPA